MGSAQRHHIVRNAVGAEFAVSLKSGAIAGAVSALSPLLSLRWVQPKAAPNMVLRLKSIKPRILVTVAFSAAGPADLGLFKATGFSAADSGGTTSLPVQGGTPQNQKITGMPASLISDLRIATTGQLTAGTRVVDTLPMKSWGGWGGAIGMAYPSDESILSAYRAHPITVGEGGASEGLILANLTAIPATGTMVLYVDLEWEEVDFLANAEEF